MESAFWRLEVVERQGLEYPSVMLTGWELPQVASRRLVLQNGSVTVDPKML